MDLPATYNDGTSAVSRPVRVGIDGPSLVARDADGFEVARWPLDEVRLVARPGDGQAPRLACGFDRGDRLTLEDAAPLDGLVRQCPNLRRTNPGWRRHGRQIALWGGLAVVSVALLVTVFVPWMAKAVAVAMPPAVERTLGDGAKDQIIKVLTFGRKGKGGAVCDGAEGRRVLDRLAARLYPDHRAGLPVSVTVVDSDIANALALPGGNVLVFRGLIDMADNGNEVAAVLAHEIGHVHYRHPIMVSLEQAGTSALIGLLLGDVTGGTVIAATATTLIDASYSRDLERQADAYGIELMNRAGLEAAGIGALLARIGKTYGDLKGWSALLSTHPETAERARAAMRDSHGTGKAFTDAEWQAVKHICD